MAVRTEARIVVVEEEEHTSHLVELFNTVTVDSVGSPKVKV